MIGGVLLAIHYIVGDHLLFEPCSDQLHVRSSHIQYADLPEE